MPEPIGLSITSDPDATRVETGATARPRERAQAPRIVLVADLDPQGTEARGVESVHQNGFAEWMRAWSPRLEVSVENRMGGAARVQGVLVADSLDAFAPENLARQIPALARLVGTRQALAEHRAGRLDLDALEARLETAGVPADQAAPLLDALRRPTAPREPGPADPDASSAVDRILGLVGDAPPAAAPSTPSGRADSLLDRLTDAATGPAGDVPNPAADGPIADLDRRIAAQLDAVLNDPEVRAFEAAWRGLKFVLDRCAGRGGLQVEVLAATKAQLAERTYHHVLMPEHEHGARRAPLAAVVVAHAFGHTPPDIEALADLASTGQSLQVPVVADAAPAFFGLDGPGALPKMPLLGHLLREPQYLPFHKLRQNEDAAFLTLAVAPFLLRMPHGKPGEAAYGLEESGHLWGGGALLVAAAMGEAQRDAGWPTAVVGRAVGDLPVRQTRMGALPLAASFSDAVLRDLGAAGLAGFRGALNTDRAVLVAPVVVGLPKGGKPPATLPSAVFAALAAHRVLGLERDLAGTDAPEAAAELDARLRQFLGGTQEPDAVTVQHLEQHEQDDSRTYGLRLRPPRAVVPVETSLVLGATVPKTPAPDQPAA